MHFGDEQWLWPLLGALVVIILGALLTLGRDRVDLRQLGAHNFVLNPGLLFFRRTLKALLALLALGLMFLGGVRLQGQPSPEDLKLNGIDVMVVLDLSKSMLSQDLLPNRLEAAKKSVRDWMRGREGDRVGLVVFAGQSLIQVPLTFDWEAVSLVLDRDDVDAIDRGGTDIGDGIRTALAAFPKDNPENRGRAILLLTDGEPTRGASSIPEACQAAKDKKVPVVAVGVGTKQGRPIPNGTSFWGEAQYKKDQSGNTVISRLDEANLKQIAETTGGVFVQGDTPEGLASVEGSLEKLKKTEMKGKGVTRRQELAPAMGWGAAGALMLAMLI